LGQAQAISLPILGSGLKRQSLVLGKNKLLMFTSDEVTSVLMCLKMG